MIGNPNLKQEFQNNLNLSYNNYKVLSERSIYVGSYFTFTNNDISSTYTIDSKGKRTTQYINVNGNYSGSIYAGYNIKIPKTKFRIFLRPEASINNNNNYVNGLQNLTKNYSVGSTFGIRYYKEEKLNFDIAANPTYSKSTSSISTVAGTHYWTYDYTFNGSVYPVKKLEIGTDIDFNLRQKINAFDKNNNVIVWNAFIEKKFFKSEELTLRASVNDILNQNKGYDRSIQPNAIVERHYLTFQRYGLITLTWNFKNKGGAGAPKSMF